MSNCITARLSVKERQEIEAIAGKSDGEVPGLEDMALALLKSHLVLIRDCANVLPGEGRPSVKPKPGSNVYSGKHGVSLRDGVHVTH